MPENRLIATAVRPLDDDAEMRLAAVQLLGDLENPGCQGAEQAIARWNSVDAKSRKPVWKWVLWILLVVATVAVVVRDSRSLVRYAVWGNWARGFSIFSSVPMPVAELKTDLSPEQKLLFSVDPAKGDAVVQKEALWRSNPEEPAFLAEYAVAYQGDRGSLPPDFLKTAREIDPQNSWFTYFAAAIEGKDSVKRNKRTPKRVSGWNVYSEPVSWQILDAARLDRAVEILRQAESQGKFENYAVEMFMNRWELLQKDGMIENLDAVGMISSQGSSFSIPLRPLGDVIAASAWSAAEAGDVGRYREIARLGDRVLNTMTTGGVGTMVDGLITNVVFMSIAENFANAADRLGLKEDAARWKQIFDRLNEWRQSKGARSLIVDGKPIDPHALTGILLGNSVLLLARQVERHPPLTDADLKPGRLVDHEILSRFFGYISWMIMGVGLAAAWAYRFRVSRLGRRLSGRMEVLLGGWDWAWILGVGIILPFAYMMAINRLTPLGGRQFGAAGNLMLLPGIHFFGLIVLWLTVPVQVIRWRLAKTAGVLGFPGTTGWGWLAVVCATAFVPLAGWMAVSRAVADFWMKWISELGFASPAPVDERLRGWITLGCLGVSLFYVAARTFFAVLSNRQQVIHHATTARVLVKAYGLAMLVLALATMGFKASERYWFQHDRLSNVDPEKPGWSAFEHDVTLQMRKEMREILGDQTRSLEK